MRSLPRPCLTLVTDRSASRRPLVQAIDAAVSAGTQMVIIRERDLALPELRNLVVTVQRAVGSRSIITLNGPPELAREIDVAGIHLPEKGPSLAEVRAIVGKQMLIGRSVHSAAAAQKAAEEGADYVLVGSIYPTASHPGQEPVGIPMIRAVHALVSLPIIGIGGITMHNAGEVLSAGADGVAVISAILSSTDPADAARKLMQSLRKEKI